MDTRSSKIFLGNRRIVIIILIILLFINIIASAFIFLDIRILEMPDTTIKIDLIELSPDDVMIYYNIEINNPNQFELIIDNFEIVTNTKEENIIAEISIAGGCIPPQGKRTFSSTERIAFEGEGYSVLTSKISGTVGVKFLGLVKKTMPIAVNVITSADEIINSIESPIIHIWGDFGEITTKRINFTGIIEIYNPNHFEMYIEDLIANFETETGKNVGKIDISGGVVPAKSSLDLKGEGSLLIEALNANNISVNMTSSAGIKIAGINKKIPYSISTHIKIPKIEDIINMNIPTDAIITSDIKATPRGFRSLITLEINNPNKIGFIAKDIVVSIFRVDKDDRTLIGECSIQEGEVGPESQKILTAEIPLPYRKVLFSRGKGFLPDALLVMVRANVTLPGLDQHIWIGVSGYQDMHPFF